MAHIEVPPIEIDLNDFLTSHVNYNTIENLITKEIHTPESSENIGTQAKGSLFEKVVELNTSTKSNYSIQLDLNTQVTKEGE